MLANSAFVAAGGPVPAEGLLAPPPSAALPPSRRPSEAAAQTASAVIVSASAVAALAAGASVPARLRRRQLTARRMWPGGRRSMHVAVRALSDVQEIETLQRLSGISRDMVEHAFEESDLNNDGILQIEEFDFLCVHLGLPKWTLEQKKDIMAKADTDNSGGIDFDELFRWFVKNVTIDGVKARVELDQEEYACVTRCLKAIPSENLALIEELGARDIQQKVTHPMSSADGRTLADHFISSFAILYHWGADETLCNAMLMHALYQRGDGFQAVSLEEMQPRLQKMLGDKVERLIYLFPSAHKSIFSESGLLHAPIGPITIPDILTGKDIDISLPERAALCNMELVNSYDQQSLSNNDPISNLWSYWQHATIQDLLLPGGREVVEQYRIKGEGASCADIVEWHETRYEEAGKPMEEKWVSHLQMFKPGGRYEAIEQAQLSMVPGAWRTPWP